MSDPKPNDSKAESAKLSKAQIEALKPSVPADYKPVGRVRVLSAGDGFDVVSDDKRVWKRPK